LNYQDRYPTPLRLLCRLIDLALVVLGSLILLLVFGNAVLRGSAGFDLAWSLEVTAFLLLWVTFLGSAAAMARRSHMRVTEVAEKLVPAKLKKPLAIVIDIGVAAVLLSLIYNGYNISRLTWAQNTTVLYWPVGILYASMPVGMILTLIFHLYNFYLDNWPQAGSGKNVADSGAISLED